MFVALYATNDAHRWRRKLRSWSDFTIVQSTFGTDNNNTHLSSSLISQCLGVDNSHLAHNWPSMLLLMMPKCYCTYRWTLLWIWNPFIHLLMLTQHSSHTPANECKLNYGGFKTSGNVNCTCLGEVLSVQNLFTLLTNFGRFFFLRILSVVDHRSHIFIKGKPDRMQNMFLLRMQYTIDMRLMIGTCFGCS